jgi:drug/metabolite transporter (DMT)-like permease
VFAVVLTTQSSGLVAVAVAAPLLGGAWITRDALIAAAGGLGGVLGLLCFYRSLAIGPMSVAAPLSAVLAAMVPLATGVALGERPGVPAWVGIPLALAAIVVFSREETSEGPAKPGSSVLLLSTLAGLGFGSFFVALDKVSEDSGLWPIVAGRAASVVLILVVVLVTRTSPALPRSVVPIAFVGGVFDTLANVFVLLANRYGDLSTVAVISSLYPVMTVLLAQVVLRERFTRAHLGGSVAAVAAVVLIALGQGGEPTRQQEVAERGAPVMGFDLDRTTHQFTSTARGGVQTVIADDLDDDEQVMMIRDHLAQAADRFRNGDFDDPAGIHGEEMPGLAVLRREHLNLVVTFAVTDGGATLTYESDDTRVVEAIHDWFAAQLHDHGSHAEPGVTSAASEPPS